jgi:hypothetical protein
VPVPRRSRYHYPAEPTGLSSESESLSPTQSLREAEPAGPGDQRQAAAAGRSRSPAVLSVVRSRPQAGPAGLAPDFGMLCSARTVLTLSGHHLLCWSALSLCLSTLSGLSPREPPDPGERVRYFDAIDARLAGGLMAPRGSWQAPAAAAQGVGPSLFREVCLPGRGLGRLLHRRLDPQSVNEFSRFVARQCLFRPHLRPRPDCQRRTLERRSPPESRSRSFIPPCQVSDCLNLTVNS